MKQARRRRKRTVLLTGATGLLGSMVLAELLSEGISVVVHARARNRIDPERRVRRVLDSLGVRLEQGSPSLRVIDASRPVDQTIEPGELDSIVHAAAAVKFSTDADRLEQDNVRRTRELLEQLDRVAPEAEFHYVSSAYACGIRSLPVPESPFPDLTDSYRQPYEKTKRMAENLVIARCEAAGRAWSIHRPSIIAGSSVDGVAANFNGIYAFLRCADVLSRRPRNRSDRVRIRCDPFATKNVVPVDWVARVIAALVRKGASRRVYHLTTRRPIPHVQLLDHVEAATNCVGIEFAPMSQAGSTLHYRSPLQRFVDSALAEFAPYLEGEPEFDRLHVAEDLPDLAVPPPLDAAYFKRLLAFARAARWSAYPLEDSVPNDSNLIGGCSTS